MDWDIFSTEGRIRRWHYVAYIFAISVASGIIQIISELLFNKMMASIVIMIFTLFSCWPSYCIAVRRAHDCGHGDSFVIWMYVLLFVGAVLLGLGIPMTVLRVTASMATISLAFTLLLGSTGMALFLLFAGPDGPNEWGSDPR